jgi:molybdate transport system substrate-binding protein
VRRRGLAALLAITALTLAACGGSSATSTTTGPSGGSLIVSAAASLKPAFTTYAGQLSGAQIHYSFAGSDQLAAQIEQGVRPDVFASANTKLPKLLYGKGLVEQPIVFAANRLVLAVPAGAARIHSLADLERPGVTVAIGSATVPIGIYTRTVLARLGPASARILANVRTNEPDVSGIVGKLVEGAVEAGFLYATDVRASHGKLTAIPLPARLQPVVAYGVAVVKGGHNPALARRFVLGLLRGAGHADLLSAGFLPPPA